MFDREPVLSMKGHKVLNINDLNNDNKNLYCCVIVGIYQTKTSVSLIAVINRSKFCQFNIEKNIYIHQYRLAIEHPTSTALYGKINLMIHYTKIVQRT